MSLLAPYMLFGLVLAAAPVVIHLLNRRRFIRVDWAPMEYLKLTLKANRRRLRIEQILLLIVRTLIVVLLVLAVARLVAQRDSLAGMLSRARTTRVIVIDDTLSMGARGERETAFERARDAAASLVEMSGAKDSLTVLTASRPSEPLIRQARIEESAALLQTLGALPVTDVANRWKSTFEEIDRHLEAAAFPMREVILITDLQREGWSGELTEITDRWAGGQTKVFLVDVGMPSGANLVLESFESPAGVVLAGSRNRLLAKVRNDGAETVFGARAILAVEGGESVLALPDLPSGEAVEVPVTVNFDAAGQHRVELRLPEDAVPGDNRAQRIVEVRETLDITLVDGEPGSRPFAGETDFLALAFSVGQAPWRAGQATDAEWLNSPLSAPDVLVLANVAGLQRERIRELEAMVRSGMGLMIFPGDRIDPLHWNELLHRRGEGLLPVAVEGPADVEVQGLLVEPFPDSPLSALSKLSPESLARVQPRRILRVEAPSADEAGARVLLRWNDAGGAPALIERTFGDGRVLLWTVAADRAWSDWATDPSYVLAMRLAVESLAVGTDAGANVIAGGELVREFEPSRKPAKATLIHPGKNDPVSVALEDGEAAASPGTMARYGDTRMAGFYRMSWEDPLRGTQSHDFAVRPDTRESRLGKLGTARLEQLLGRVEWEVIPHAGAGRLLGAQGAELWRSFIFAMLALMGVESLLAAWVGRPK